MRLLAVISESPFALASASLGMPNTVEVGPMDPEHGGEPFQVGGVGHVDAAFPVGHGAVPEPQVEHQRQPLLRQAALLAEGADVATGDPTIALRCTSALTPVVLTFASLIALEVGSVTGP